MGEDQYQHVRENGLFEPFMCKNDHFTKTGSGQKHGEAPKNRLPFSQVELTRDIARSFNKRYKKAFRVPAVLPADR
eukprot:COSAG06_NODE_33869_length_483_cov_0.763021_1_plen_76_part_00